MAEADRMIREGLSKERKEGREHVEMQQEFWAEAQQGQRAWIHNNVGV